MTAAVAMRKVWERHDGQINLLFCDEHVEAVSSGDPFYEKSKTL
jgi:prepilin-type processing-associated H-X9-DG protein